MHEFTHTLEAAPADFVSQFTCPVSVLEAAPDSGGTVPRFEMVAYTGGPIQPKTNPPLRFPVVVDLATLDLTASSQPALLDHNPSARVGHIEGMTTDGKTLNATGFISAASGHAAEVVASARNGFKWQTSFGLAYPAPELLAAGKSLNINGRDITGPVYVVRHARVREISFLSLGADDQTSARIAAQLAAERLAMTFEQWLASKGLTLSTLGDADKAKYQAQYDSEGTGSAAAGGSAGNTQTTGGTAQAGAAGASTSTGSDPIAAENARVLANRQRQTRVIGVLDAYRAKVPADKFGTIEAAAISGQLSETEAELQLMRLERPQTAAASGRSHSLAATGGGNLSAAAVVTAAILMTSGMTEKAVAESFPTAQREQILNAAMSSDMRGYGLQNLMDATIQAGGDYYNGSRKSNSYLRAALEADQKLRRSGSLEATGFTTLSLSGVLSNVANKGLIASYSAVNTVWNQIAAVRSHGDFKVHTRYRLDATGAFKKVAQDGELKHVGLSDAAYTNKLDTYGAIIALTRQMMINDDLSSFMEIPATLGRLAALRVEEAVFALLLSGINNGFFTVANGNYLTGAGSALSIDGLTAAETKYSNQVDSNGKPILVTPDRILVGTNQRVLATKLYKDQTVIAVGVPTGAKLVQGNGNEMAGKYLPIATPYINNTLVTDQNGNVIPGQTTTGWGMFADPAIRAAIAVAFLNGQQTPTIESAQTDFDTLGQQWRAFEDFGVGFEDPKAAVWNAGV